MAVMWGMGNFYCKWGEAKNGGWGVYNGRWEVFKVSLHSLSVGANPLFYEDPPYITYLFQVFPTPTPPISLSPPAPFRSPPLLFLLSFFLWVLNGDHITFHVLFYLIDLHMLSLGTLVQ